MKVEFLKGLGLDDEIIKQIQAESGKDVTGAKSTMQTQIDSLNAQIADLQGQVSQRDNDLNGLKTQLEQAGQSATKLSEVQQSFSALQEKYTQETADYKKKLEDQEYEFSAREAMSGIKFSCNAAKKEFLGNLIAEKLPIKDGVLLGFDQFVEAQKKSDPDAFVTEGSNNPKFSNPNNPTPPPKQEGNDSIFGFNFIGVREKNN